MVTGEIFTLISVCHEETPYLKWFVQELPLEILKNNEIF